MKTWSHWPRDTTIGGHGVAGDHQPRERAWRMSTWTAERLREWRTSRGISQREAAELVGRSLRMYCYYESGERPIDRAVIALLGYLDSVPKRKKS